VRGTMAAPDHGRTHAPAVPGVVHPASCSAAPRRPRTRPWLTPIARERQKNERLFVLPSFLWCDVCWVARYDVLPLMHQSAVAIGQPSRR
jgi:hypothetical protein